jgi:hypothetical protein
MAAVTTIAKSAARVLVIVVIPRVSTAGVGGARGDRTLE